MVVWGAGFEGCGKASTFPVFPGLRQNKFSLTARIVPALGLLPLDSPLEFRRRTADSISPPVIVRRFLPAIGKGGDRSRIR